jgi:hypothetical protein
MNKTPIVQQQEKELQKSQEEAKQEVVPISTEVYLTGMTHSESPVGLLPLFSSWSLISIGKFTDYSACTGTCISIYSGVPFQ